MYNNVIICITSVIIVLIIQYFTKDKNKLYLENSKENYIFLPKNIFMFWDEGWNKIPFVAKTCVKSWEFHNPEYKIIKLDKKNVYKYLDKDLLDTKKEHISTLHIRFVYI